MKQALITGGATRLGAEIARHLHAAGYNLVLHYRRSAEEAQRLKWQLEQTRQHSVYLLKADLMQPHIEDYLLKEALSFYDQFDLLVNNASVFYATPIGQCDYQDWQALFQLNAKVPFFLAQAFAPLLKKTQGCIINLVDIHAQRPLKNYPLYSMSKAANAMMVKALARELAPDIRVNGVAPGAILWPENSGQKEQQRILERIPLQRRGEAEDIAKTVLFLAQSSYITGQIIAVDGGRTVQQ